MDTTYVTFAYGIHIPVAGSAWQEAERINETLRTIEEQCPDLRYVAGGDCTRETVSLVAYSQKVESGGLCGSAGISSEQCAAWDRQLARAIKALGYSDLKLAGPAWLCITELS